MRPLLFLGNRRSGTTLMTHIVNTHPRIYVSYERFVLWLIYQCRENRNSDFMIFPGMGVTQPMENTVFHAGDILDGLLAGQITRETMRKAFYDVSLRNKNVRKGGKDKEVDWIGEKNPETAEPFIWEFAHWLLPEARYVHMVRHPVGVAWSKRWIVENWDKNTWPLGWEGSMESLLEFWVRRERLIRGIIELGVPVVTVRLEDVWADHEREFNRVFDFLEAERSDAWHIHDDWLKPHGQSQGQEKYDLTVRWNVEGLKEMMERYEYV